jgi:hypothetical protein
MEMAKKCQFRYKDGKKCKINISGTYIVNGVPKCLCNGHKPQEPGEK